MSLKLISINIEGRKHIQERVLPFFRTQNADVICLQEVYEPDVEIFKTALNMQGIFSPRVLLKTNSGPEIVLPSGVALLSKFPIQNVQTPCYRGDPQILTELKKDDRTTNRIFLHADIVKEDEIFHIGTTHFTWTPDGQANDYQREDIKRLLDILADIPEIIICGDFNAPRGREIFNTIAERYKDRIPEKYTTSLDPDLHRIGKGSELMVDVLFTSSQYDAKNVELVCGVSDHCAVVGEIYKI